MCRFRYYNPRASWVLKPIFAPQKTKHPALQPTCIVGTKTTALICPLFPWRLQPTCIVGTKTHRNDRRPSVLGLQPTCIVGTKTMSSYFKIGVTRLQPTCIVGTKTFLFHSDSFAPIDYNPRTSRVLKQNVLTDIVFFNSTTAHVHRGY